MRKLSYKTNYLITDKLLTTIIKKHFPNSELISLSEIEFSFVNSVYQFQLSNGSDYILKFNNPRWPYKQEREVNAMELVRNRTSVPVPNIIITYSSNDEINLAYMIQEKAPGINLREMIVLGELTESELLHLISKTGSYLGEMHSIKFDFFGDILTPIGKEQNRNSYFWGKRFKNWSNCFTAFCLDILNWVCTDSFPQYRKKITEKIFEYVNKYPDFTQASFIHSDIQPLNIIINKKNISAFIDFEWAFAGNPSFEYSITRAGFYFSVFPSLTFSNIYSNYPNITKNVIDEAFLRGYQKTADHELFDVPSDLTDFIWLLYMIGSWNWSIQTSTPDQIKHFEKDIHILYRQLIL
ncbi:MAG: aminoglycoside phosphotransferase family protein [Candidatus Heimdallarchaeota archaeon]|nr:aminoglycoside phosphotransferase family protein [Candidatus Heimdallarchaeota archaeon]